uniref:Protein kinase domain-containing protein n=1 Tax=Oryza glaberrima TaxID=4538 RepID=I1PTT6_ORYGL
MAARALGKGISSSNNGGVGGGGDEPKAAWEIDLSRLRIRQGAPVKHGFRGSLFRADYDGRDVAVKLLDWGKEGFSTPEQIAHLRASLRGVAEAWHKIDHPNITKFVGASMATADLNIPQGQSTAPPLPPPPPDTPCCVVVEYLTGGTLKSYLIKHMERKLAYKDASASRCQWREG